MSVETLNKLNLLLLDGQNLHYDLQKRRHWSIFFSHPMPRGVDANGTISALP
jgi:hypothetical protein